MRKNKFLLYIVSFFFLLNVYILNSSAQEKKPEFIKIEIKAKTENFSHTAKVPISNKSFKDTKNSFEQDEIYLQSVTTVGCFDCLLSLDVDFFSIVSRLDENSSEVFFAVKFNNKKECNIENKVFTVQRVKRKEFKSKCGVKISAYYE